MGQYRKHRGYASQRAVARDLVSNGLFPYATDTGPGRAGRDILGTPGVAIEVKATSRFGPSAFMAQATANAGTDLPLVVCRLNGQGETAIDEWVCIAYAKDVRELLTAPGLVGEEIPTRRTGFDPMAWVRATRGLFGVIPYATFTTKGTEFAVLRWGDMKQMIRRKEQHQ